MVMTRDDTTRTIDEAKLETFLGQVVTDAGSAVSCLLVAIGDKLGLYKALADGTPVTPEELARRTSTNPRMIREWLANQAAGGYVSYDATSGRFCLPPEQASALADDGSPAMIQGFFQVIAAVYQSIDKEIEAFRTGHGLSWRDHHHDLFDGTKRFFRTGYRANLVSEWIPSLDGVEEKLRRGALVADVGCGHGASTIILAQAYPRSAFIGYDNHAPSIEAARKDAARAGVGERVTYEVSSAYEFPGSAYDLIAIFDAWHDMSDPVRAARHAYEALAAEGTLLLVEPFANDELKGNLNPVGRVFYGVSTVICTPNSLHEDGVALGAQAGPARTIELLERAGFGAVRVAAQTPFNLIYEARR